MTRPRAEVLARSLLEVEGLCVSFRTRDGLVAALNGIDLEVGAGDVRVVIGESGSGKSVLAHTLLGLLPRNVTVTGAARLDGHDLLAADPRRRRELRGARIAYIPQSPATALNPVRRIGPLLMEGARAKGLPAADARERLEAALSALGLDLADIRARYAHELSGGMQQRVVTALALVGAPDLVVADEPTASLDADLAAETAEQLRLVADTGAAVFVITHDLGLAAGLGGRLALLYAGCLVEDRPTAAFLAQPEHPYGQGLLAARPSQGAVPIPGMPPALTALPPGCPFAPRCEHAADVCRRALPAAFRLRDGRCRCVLHADG